LALVTFRELLEDAFLDPRRVDYAQLRRLYVESGEYRPAHRDTHGTDALNRALAAEDWEGAIALAEQLLDRDPLAVGLRLAYARALDGVDDGWEAETQRAVAHGLLRAIVASGDGRTPETALQVLDERELHVVLDRLGLRVIRSERDVGGDRWFERVECVGGRVVWFDVTWPQRWVAPPPPTGG
jgi:hypothetical protein